MLCSQDSDKHKLIETFVSCLASGELLTHEEQRSIHHSAVSQGKFLMEWCGATFHLIAALSSFC